MIKLMRKPLMGDCILSAVFLCAFYTNYQDMIRDLEKLLGIESGSLRLCLGSVYICKRRTRTFHKKMVDQ